MVLGTPPKVQLGIVVIQPAKPCDKPLIEVMLCRVLPNEAHVNDPIPYGAGMSCDLTVGWHGFPSRTRTGTATLLGEGKGVMSKPFSCLAFFNLYLWFWNQIFIWVGDNRRMLARCSLSGADRYLCCLNLLSNSYVCALLNRTRLFFFFEDVSEEERPSFPVSLRWQSMTSSDMTSSSSSSSSECRRSWRLSDNMRLWSKCGCAALFTRELILSVASEPSLYLWATKAKNE